MTEKDIVDFDDQEKFIKDEDSGSYVEKETGEEVGCEICYTHMKAYDFFESKNKHQATIANPICPHCKEQMDLDNESVVVGETNYSDPSNKLYYTNIYKCAHCGKTMCLVPADVEYNGNHDIYYTGGKDYIVDDKMRNSLYEDITRRINERVTDYITRKLNGETSLDEWNIKYWCTNEIEEAICNFLYEAGLKK